MCRTAFVLLVIIAAGCSSEPDRFNPQQNDPESKPNDAAETRAAKEVRPPSVFDGEGKLYASDEYAGGVALPMGVELFRADERTRVYRIRAPIDKVLQYFGPRLITGNVKKVGDGAVYKHASVRGAEVNPTKIDVSILEIGSNLVRIQIREIPPPPEYAPSATQTKSAARERWQRLD